MRIIYGIFSHYFLIGLVILLFLAYWVEKGRGMFWLLAATALVMISSMEESQTRKTNVKGHFTNLHHRNCLTMRSHPRRNPKNRSCHGRPHLLLLLLQCRRIPLRHDSRILRTDQPLQGHHHH